MHFNQQACESQYGDSDGRLHARTLILTNIFHVTVSAAVKCMDLLAMIRNAYSGFSDHVSLVTVAGVVMKDMAAVTMH